MQKKERTKDITIRRGMRFTIASTILFLFCGCATRTKIITESLQSQTESVQEQQVLEEDISTGSFVMESESEEIVCEGMKQSDLEIATEDSMICVYLCGAVSKPGVYRLPKGSRIDDAVTKAGGMKEDACETDVNLAELLTDGQMIQIRTVDEVKESGSMPKQNEKVTKDSDQKDASSKINLNVADTNQLQSLKGIGESKALDILEYREKNGGFRSIEELKNVPGIGDGIFQKIKDQITV